MDLRDLQPVGERHRLGVNLGAADHHDVVGAAPQRIAARRLQRGLEARRDQNPGAVKAGSRVTTMLVRRGSGLIESERYVLRPITTGLSAVRERKWRMSDFSRHGIVPPMPDHAIVGDRCDQHDLHQPLAPAALRASLASASPETRTPVHSSSISPPSDL